MDKIEYDFHSLTNFKRNSADFIKQLKSNVNPIFLTIHGKAEIVVQDAAAYQKFLDRIEAVEGIRRGLDDLAAGRLKDAADVHATLRNKYGISG